MLDVKSKCTFKKYDSETGRRLTHSPDLLVYDTEDIIMLVEVKTRGKSRWVEEGEVWIKRARTQYSLFLFFPYHTNYKDCIFAISKVAEVTRAWQGNSILSFFFYRKFYK
jgi:hypothetical protein